VARHETVVALPHGTVHLGVPSLLADVAVRGGVELKSQVHVALVDVDLHPLHGSRSESLFCVGGFEVFGGCELHVQTDEVEGVQVLPRSLNAGRCQGLELAV